jgi:transketolase
MRGAFIESLTALARADGDLVLITGDLGFGVLNDYQDELPDQFINVGVAEQNMSGVAAGLALTGHRVFTYSIGNFPTLRCLEQIRNDICYHEADVCVVTVGGGMAYGALGPSHFAIEDLAIMRALPGMMVVSPGDPYEVAQLVPQIVAKGGPAYLRLGRAGEAIQHKPGTEIILGKPAVVRRGESVCLLSTGGMLKVVLEAADALSEQGVNATVVSVHTLAPLDEEELLELLAGHDLVFTCEEHSVVGGLGGLTAELMAEHPTGSRLVRFALPRAFPQGVGSQEFLRTVNGLDAASLVQRVLDAR